MTEKQRYWIADLEGVKAEVEGVEARNYWTAIQGWSESTPPEGLDFVWLQNVEHGGKAKFVAQAVPLWEPRGWVPCEPPQVVDLATAHQSVEALPAMPQPSAPAPTKPAAPAVSGTTKE